jgi:hypothetical protein
MVYVVWVVSPGVVNVFGDTLQEFTETVPGAPGPEMVQVPVDTPVAVYEMLTAWPGWTRVLEALMETAGLMQAASVTLSEQEPPDPVQERV